MLFPRGKVFCFLTLCYRVHSEPSQTTFLWPSVYLCISIQGCRMQDAYTAGLGRSSQYMEVTRNTQAFMQNPPHGSAKPAFYT